MRNAHKRLETLERQAGPVELCPMIEGLVSDPEGAQRQAEQWQRTHPLGLEPMIVLLTDETEVTYV